MVDLKVVEAMGGTPDRLREVFSAKPVSVDQRASYSQDQLDANEKDCKLRKEFEEDINLRLMAQINYCLKNYQMYSAIDLAWDAAPINKATYPLMLYAQGKLDLNKCSESLRGLPNIEKYVTKNAQGDVTNINLPKFFEVNFNFVRSVVTRRLAAQANKYMSLYPNFKYEARSTSQVAKLRADVLSQVMDIMTDAMDLRHHDVQVMRDSMLYGHSVDFVRAKWEREEQLIMDPDINPELIVEGKPKYKSVITKEGVAFVNPHPSRIGWDNAYPLPAINSDTGGRFIIYWDVIRYGDVQNNPEFWNRDEITYSTTLVQLFSTYAQYFSQYFCTIQPPCQTGADASSFNDRANNIGLYSQSLRDSAMVTAQYYRKIIPKEHGLGRYPYPVWLRMVIAGQNTVLFAEFMPSTPACVCSINENDGRQNNISIAMELLPYQDQMTQLLSLLLLTIQSSNLRVLLCDTDTATPEQIQKFRDQISGTNQYNYCTVFEYSGAKMKDLGIDPRQVISMVETQPSTALTSIFTAMAELVKLAERLMALSPQELGQPAPSGISATETNLIGATTETMYGFISDAIDEFRSAKKRILYESYMVCGDQEVRVPAINRYTRKIIEKAGFQVLDEDAEPGEVSDDTPQYHTIIGTKQRLNYDYIFTSRDGALRAVNTQSANVLTQLLGVLQNPVIMQALGKEKFYNIVNEIFRLSGAGVDLNLELGDGESNQMGPDKQAQMEQLMSQLVQHLEQIDKQMQQLAQQNQDTAGKFEELRQIVDGFGKHLSDLETQPVQPDPMKMAETQQRMQINGAKANQSLAAGALDMKQSAEKHMVDTSLKLLQPMNGSGP